jgi:hypothetical protein
MRKETRMDHSTEALCAPTVPISYLKLDRGRSGARRKKWLGDCSLDLHQEREYGRSPLREAGNMRKRSALGIAVLACLLVLAMALPAHAAPRLRLYRGETSQGDGIRFVIAKSDAGRFVRELSVGHITLTCEDQSTVEFGFGYFFSSRGVPITNRAFLYDDVVLESAFHIAGDLGPLQGQGTLSSARAVITPDEQAAQLCTSGDLTWTVGFVRRL